MKETGNLHYIDSYVGGRIRQARFMVRLSQKALAELLGLSYQQIQKYETGTNRISASALYRIAQVLRKSPDWFFEDADQSGCDDPPGLVDKRETLDLIRAYYAITNPVRRKAVASLVRALRKS